jgi:hypothetical protein
VSYLSYKPQVISSLSSLFTFSFFRRNVRSYSVDTLSTNMKYTPLLLNISMSPSKLLEGTTTWRTWAKREKNVLLAKCVSMTFKKWKQHFRCQPASSKLIMWQSLYVSNWLHLACDLHVIPITDFCLKYWSNSASKDNLPFHWYMYKSLKRNDLLMEKIPPELISLKRSAVYKFIYLDIF